MKFPLTYRFDIDIKCCTCKRTAFKNNISIKTDTTREIGCKICRSTTQVIFPEYLEVGEDATWGRKVNYGNFYTVTIQAIRVA